MLKNNLQASSTFSLLNNTILKKDVDSFRRALEPIDILFDMRDDAGKTLLHYAVWCKARNIVDYIFHAILPKQSNLPDRRKALSFIEEQDEFGKTCLHIAAEINDYDFFNGLFECLDTNEAAKIIRIVDNEGNLAIDLLSQKIDISQPSILKAQEKIIQLLMNDIRIPINQLVDYKDLLEKYKESCNKQASLAQNFLDGCLIVNEVRRQIKYSSTHPTNYGLDETKLISNNNLLHELRESPENLTSDKLNRLDKLASLNAMLTYADKIKAIAVANCYEMSLLGALITFELTNQFEVSLCNIAPGDHVFLVLFVRGGKNHDGLVVDPWAGKVYPTETILSELSYHKYQMFQNKAYHITGPINGDYHKIHHIISINREDCVRFKNNKVNNSGAENINPSSGALKSAPVQTQQMRQPFSIFSAPVNPLATNHQVENKDISTASIN